MKQFLFLLLLFVVTACNNETELENSKTNLIQSAYEESKDITIAHNEILDAFYQQCILNNVKFDKPLTVNDLPKIADDIICSIDNKQIANTRSSVIIDKNVICETVLMNKKLFPSTRSAATFGSLNKEYLKMFCDEFHKINENEATKENIDEVIKKILNKVYYKYPTLSNKQIEELAFVSSVTYHSYIYWSEHAIDWYMNLKKGVPAQTRGIWKDLWGAVKSGTLKWVEADAEGAAWGVVFDPTRISALAGAAGGSVAGAIRNFGLRRTDYSDIPLDNTLIIE